MQNEPTTTQANASAPAPEVKTPEQEGPKRQSIRDRVSPVLIETKNQLGRSLFNEKVYQRQLSLVPGDEAILKEIAATQRNIKMLRASIEVLEETLKDEANDDGEINRAVWGAKE